MPKISVETDGTRQGTIVRDANGERISRVQEIHQHKRWVDVTFRYSWDEVEGVPENMYVSCLPERMMSWRDQQLWRSLEGKLEQQEQSAS